MGKKILKGIYGILILLMLSITMIACGAKTFTMTFKVDGSVYGIITKYEEGAKVSIPSDPTKVGYTFTGWNITIPDTMPGKDLIAHAKFSPNEYTITFDYNGATNNNAITTQRVTYDAVVGTLPEPIKTGYTFVGWYHENTEINSASVYTIPNNVTLVARYDASDLVVRFYKDSDCSELYATRDVKYNESIESVPEVPVKTGYSGVWSVNDFSHVKSELKVYPVYTAKKYKISFTTNGIDDVDVTFDSVVGTLPIDTKDHEYFIGWYYEDTLVSSDDIYRFDRDITLTSRFSTSRRVVKFYTNSSKNELYATRYIGGSDTTPSSIPTPPYKRGHTSSWDKSLDNITTDIDVWATYTVNTYTIKYMIGDTEYDTVTYSYGETITLPVVADSDEYVFVKWDIDHTTMPDEDLVVYAEVIYFTIDLSLYKNNEISISKGGTYTLRGNSNDVTFTIDTLEEVTLKLNNVNHIGTRPFIKSNTSAKVNINVLSGTTNTIECTTNVVGISIAGELNILGIGVLNIVTIGNGIEAGSVVSNEETRVSIHSKAIGIKVETISIKGATISIQANRLDGVDRYIESATGKYVLVENQYILDDGTYTSETHYDMIVVGGIVCDTYTMEAGHVIISSDIVGISVVNTITIIDGIIDIVAFEDGIVAKIINIGGGDINLNNISAIGIHAESITTTGGDIFINSGSLGMDIDTTATMEDTKIVIESRGDGIKASTISMIEMDVTITTVGTFVRDDTNGIYKNDGGKYTRFLKSDLGKFAYKYRTTMSVKGIYALESLTIKYGNYNINSIEDSLHSDKYMYIFSGNISLETLCDAIYSYDLVQIGYMDVEDTTSDFNIVVSTSYVGIYSAVVEMYDGNTLLHSYTDGIYVRPSANLEISHYINVSKSAILSIDALEDGLDVKGDIIIDGGKTYIFAGNQKGNLALSYTGEFYYTLGELLAIGNTSMIPSSVSLKNKYVAFSLDETQSRKCTRNTYLMLYDTLEEVEDSFSLVVFLGIRNYISGMTLVYGSADIVEGKSVSLKYAASVYTGGVVPNILPYICTGGVYDVVRCSTIEGRVFEAGYSGMVYGTFKTQTEDYGVINSFNRLEGVESVVVETIRSTKGSVTENPVVTPPEESEPPVTPDPPVDTPTE